MTIRPDTGRERAVNTCQDIAMDSARHSYTGRPSSPFRAHAHALLLALLAAAASTTARAQASAPAASAARPSYSEAVEVRGAGTTTLYVSALVPEPADASAAKDARAYFGDLRTQTDGLLRRLKSLLERRGYALGDVVKVNVFLVADPALGHTVDNAGFAASYDRYFGAADVPTPPARTRATVAALTNPQWLIAIDAVAAKSAP